MKIVTDEEILVQKNDLIYLMHSGKQIPQSIIETFFGESCVVIDKNNKNDFVRFTLPSEISFLNSIEWILDYSSLKSLTAEELQRLEDVLAKRYTSIKEKYLAMSTEERKSKSFFISQIQSTEYQLLTIKDFKEHKHEPIKVANNSSHENIRKEPGIKQFLKSIFKK